MTKWQEYLSVYSSGAPVPDELRKAAVAEVIAAAQLTDADRARIAEEVHQQHVNLSTRRSLVEDGE